MRFLKLLFLRCKEIAHKFRLLLYPKAVIKRPEDCGEKIAVFMNEGEEEVKMIPVFSFIEEGSFKVHLPEISLWKFKKGLLFGDSDMVILDGGKNVIFPKYYNYNYNTNIVADRNYINEENGFVSYKKYKKRKHYNAVFSLLGKFSHIWAHALVEYFPKISMLNYAIEDCNEKLTVLVPNYKDIQLREIIYDQLGKYDVNIEVVENEVTIEADTIYYMERPTKFTDRETSVAIGDQLIPKQTVDAVRTMLVEPHIKNVIPMSKYKKIFLPRRGGIGKSILNALEIEDYFKREGFSFVEPHKVSFEEKIQIFQSADVIVGPFGSAFTNLIFCKPGTKVLIFSNYQRLFENYFSMPLQYYGVDIHYVIGCDNKRENPAHCSFTISLDKVKTASKVYGILSNE